MTDRSQAHRMTAETHTQLAGFIWSICNLLAPTKAQVLSEHQKSALTMPDNVADLLLQLAS